MNAAVSPSKQPGYVELRFDHVPSPMIRAELKAARFRWNPVDKCWWGEEKNMPSRYRTELRYSELTQDADDAASVFVPEATLEDLVETILSQVREEAPVVDGVTLEYVKGSGHE